MPMDVTVQSRVRGAAPTLENLSSGSDNPTAINPRGDLLVAQSLPPSAELVRMGRSFMAVQTSAVAPVAALPTTTAQLSLWNGEPAGGRIYIIDSVFAICVVSAGAATGLGLVGMMNVARTSTPPTADLTPKGLAGQAYNGKGIVDLAVGSLVDDGWHPLGSSVVGPASQIGLTVDVPLEGRYIIPSGGGYFHLACVANTAATITVRMGIRWHEVQLPLNS